MTTQLIQYNILILEHLAIPNVRPPLWPSGKAFLGISHEVTGSIPGTFTLKFVRSGLGKKRDLGLFWSAVVELYQPVGGRYRTNEFIKTIVANNKCVELRTGKAINVTAVLSTAMTSQYSYNFSTAQYTERTSTNSEQKLFFNDRKGSFCFKY